MNTQKSMENRKLPKDAIVFMTKGHGMEGVFWRNRRAAIRAIGLYADDIDRYFEVLHVRPAAVTETGVLCYIPSLDEHKILIPDLVFPIDDPFESPDSLQDRIDKALVLDALGELRPMNDEV